MRCFFVVLLILAVVPCCIKEVITVMNKHILMFTDTWGVGGIEQVILASSRTVLDAGASVTLYANSKWSSLADASRLFLAAINMTLRFYRGIREGSVALQNC